MKAIIVDDEYYAIQGLKMELEEIGGIEIVGMYEDCLKMLDEVEKIRPDVIFLDIEMPQMDGFELFWQLVDKRWVPNIVFVTAYSHYAVKAFEINAIDYIVKPVTKSRLLKTLERIKSDSVPEEKTILQINCFKHFSILMNGKEINSGWRTRKAEELIAYLLCENGRFVAKEKIAEALWPGLDGEKGVSNLYLAYYYIKKMENKTGAKIPIESERGKMRIRMEEISCDMARFDRILRDRTHSNTADWRNLLEEAVGLYKGTLLEDAYYSWAVELQQKYEIEYAEILKDLIECCTQQSDTEKMRYYEEKLNMLK